MGVPPGRGRASPTWCWAMGCVCILSLRVKNQTWREGLLISLLPFPKGLCELVYKPIPILEKCQDTFHTNSNRYVHPNVHSSIVYSCQDTEAT